MNENSNNAFCVDCPFTCKGAEICRPRQLVTEMQAYLPSVVDDYDRSVLRKPDISVSVEINGHTYYF